MYRVSESPRGLVGGAVDRQRIDRLFHVHALDSNAGCGVSLARRLSSRAEVRRGFAMVEVTRREPAGVRGRTGATRSGWAAGPALTRFG
jgi:hypothetical protein